MLDAGAPWVAPKAKDGVEDAPPPKLKPPEGGAAPNPPGAGVDPNPPGAGVDPNPPLEAEPKVVEDVTEPNPPGAGVAAGGPKGDGALAAPPN